MGASFVIPLLVAVLVFTGLVSLSTTVSILGDRVDHMQDKTFLKYKSLEEYLALPWCTPENLKLDSLSDYKYDLHLQNDGTVSPVFRHCKLKIFTYRQAYNCLKGNHLVWLGDSITRYQTLSFMYFITNRKWPNRLLTYTKTDSFYSNLHNPKRPAITSPSFYGKNWKNFHLATNKNLNFRDPYSYSRTLTELPDERHDNSHMFHINRKYFHNNTPEHQLRMSFFLWYGSEVSISFEREFTYLPSNMDYYEKDYLKYLTHKYCSKHIGLVPLTSDCYEMKLPQDSVKPKIFATTDLDKACEYKIPKNMKEENQMLQEELERWEDFMDTPPLAVNSTKSKDSNQTIDPLECHAFERNVLAAIDATHLIFNFGLHLAYRPNPMAKLFDRFIVGTKRYLVPPSTKQRIRLPQLTWKQSTQSFRDLNYTYDAKVSKLLSQNHSFYDTSKHLYLTGSHWNPFYELSRKNASYEDYQQVFNISLVNVTAGNYPHYPVPKFHPQIHKFKHVIPEDSKPLGQFAIGDFSVLLYKLDRYVDNYQDLFAKWKKSSSKNFTQSPLPVELYTFNPNMTWVFTRDLKKTYADLNHFEPFVYNEFNNFFLNSVCPHLPERVSNSTEGEVYEADWDELVGNVQFNSCTRISSK